MSRDSKRRAIAANVASILRKERERRGLSMNAVATRAGLSQQMVSYVERSLRNPTLDTMLRMTEAIGIDLYDVIKAATVRTNRGLGDLGS